MVQRLIQKGEDVSPVSRISGILDPVLEQTSKIYKAVPAKPQPVTCRPHPAKDISRRKAEVVTCSSWHGRETGLHEIFVYQRMQAE